MYPSEGILSKCRMTLSMEMEAHTDEHVSRWVHATLLHQEETIIQH